ncbi:ATP-binding protein [Streptomyces sp. NPDC126497]|uniref:ATP-binding protein n=1 Tax=Streptomyces sp. NPDC126497 TaxID=3155313 RepID=UPI00331AF0E5
MVRIVRNTPGRTRPRNARAKGLWLTRMSAGSRQFVRGRRHRLITSLEARRGITRPRKWRRWNSYATATRVCGALAVVLVVVWAVVDPYPEKWFDTLMRYFFGPVLTAGFATALFLFCWYSWTRKRYLDKARKKPNEMVVTAGPHLAEVVGRQEIAQVLAQRLRERSTRRPYLLTGGLGVGKTAVLVRLTEMLARQHAVPVPIRLRDAVQQTDLNFEQMAKQRFAEEAPRGILARSKNDRVWQQLLADDKPVVIADGLEEALLDEKLQDDRDNIIRRAIERADREKLPLVIASRPHASLEGSRAAIIELEPLSEEEALHFVEAQAPEADERRLDWLVETAEATESPIYLQIARQLHQHGILADNRPRHDPDQVDTRSTDRSTLRLWLLDTWYRALARGRLKDDVALAPQDRRDTLEAVSALACVGLLQDKAEVDFADLLGTDLHPSLLLRAGTQAEHLWDKGPGADRYGKRGNDLLAWHRKQIWSVLCARLSSEESRRLLGGNVDQCHAVLARFMSNAGLLELVEGFTRRVRFPHSVLQAYLGFRMLHHLGERRAGALIAQALHPPGPSRELLIALVLLSRRQAIERAAAGGGIAAEVEKDARELWRQAPLSGQTLAQRLRRAADRRTDPKAFDLYAAALEIDSAEKAPRLLEEITGTLKTRWHDVKGAKRTLDEAKLGLVKQLGAALRAADGKTDTTSLYTRLFELGFGEPSYSVRIAAAQEFGDGGDPAFAVIRRWIGTHTDPVEEYRSKTGRLKERRRQEERACAARARRRPGIRGAPRTTREEDDRLAHDRQAVFRRYQEDRAALWREFTMRAWLLPMLLGSVSENRRDEARNRLRKWLGHLDPKGPGGTSDLPLTLENALAQGFKYAANRRKHHPHTYQGGRDDLIRNAEFMLRQSRSWYAQLTLLHALCLWELPDGVARDEQGGDTAAQRRGGRGDAREPSSERSSRGTSAVQTVERWLSMAGTARPAAHVAADGGAFRQPLHPFVAEAGDLVALALETRQPERFIWIDEKGVADHIGSRSSGLEHYRKHNLWIPPSVGWGALGRRAQHLVADVLLMLNLIERDGQPDEIEDRLERSNRPGMSLPPCITADRTPLHPELTVGISAPPVPGTTCLPTCTFKLCPYPPQGVQPRAELREPFCLQQQALLSGIHFRRTPCWVGMRVPELRRFWGAMADRRP